MAKNFKFERFRNRFSKLATSSAAVLAVAALVAGVSGWLYSRNSLFMLSDINVKTDNHDLERDLKNGYIGFLGKRLTALSLRELETFSLKDRRVKKVIFHKRWPSSLLILIEERKPVAMTFIQGKLWEIDDHGDPIILLTRAKSLPLLKRYGRQGGQLDQICSWLGSVRDRDLLDEVEWVEDRGLVVRNYSQNYDVELGFEQFDLAWEKVASAVAFIKSKNISGVVLDASYLHRVVIGPKLELQNSENKLNLRKLVRRTDSFSPAAR